MAQLRLPFPDGPYDRASLIASPSNEEALTALENWRHWPDNVVVLVGDEATGKTHLATVWAAENGAARLEASALATMPLDMLFGIATGPMVLDDADRAEADNALFHLINLATQHNNPLVLTSRLLPNFWPAKLPDLVSRLAALRVVHLNHPDDAVLSELLRRGAARRGYVLDDATRKVVLTRMDRSFAAAAAFVEAFDAELTRRPGVSPSTLARGAMAALYPATS